MGRPIRFSLLPHRFDLLGVPLPLSERSTLHLLHTQVVLPADVSQILLMLHLHVPVVLHPLHLHSRTQDFRWHLDVTQLVLLV
jgi:hypothetical protein